MTQSNDDIALEQLLTMLQKRPALQKMVVQSLEQRDRNQFVSTLKYMLREQRPPLPVDNFTNLVDRAESWFGELFIERRGSMN